MPFLKKEVPMKCTTPGCKNLVFDFNEKYCLQCKSGRLPNPQRSHTPLKQAAESVCRKRKVEGEGDPWRSRSAPREYVKKQKHDISLQKRSLSPSFSNGSSGLCLSERPYKINLPILFIPFEANFSKRMLGGYISKGNKTFTMTEKGSKSFMDLTNGKRVDKPTLEGTVGSSKFLRGDGGSITKFKEFAKSKALASTKIPNFYEAVTEDRLRYLHFCSMSTPVNGLPEVIVLSERLLDWPPGLSVFGLQYTKVFELKCRGLQDMAAYVLHGLNNYSFKLSKRQASYKKKKSFTENWLIVRKHSSHGMIFSVGCVHLSSKYTSCSTNAMAPVMNELLEFAKAKHLHAILGDCNMNTYGYYGGAIPTSNTFVYKDKTLHLDSVFATNNGGGDKSYMGGLICNKHVTFKTTLTTFGLCMIPPCFLDGNHMKEVFSDHHSLYYNFLYSPYSDFSSLSSNSDGNCFFTALKKRKGSSSDVNKIRASIIDAIAPMLRSSLPDITRQVLVHIPRTQFAVSKPCPTLDVFIAEMRKPGRWVDDTIIPYIAMLLKKRIIIQYTGCYAIFRRDATRDDNQGIAPKNDKSSSIQITCRDNHYY